MDNTKELKPIYDIFTAAWRAYREHYPPGNPQDDTYWSKLIDDLHEIESQYNCQLCRDILCNVASDLEHKAKSPVSVKVTDAGPYKRGESFCKLLYHKQDRRTLYQ